VQSIAANGSACALLTADAGIERNEISYIYAHGTSTEQKNALETLAARRVFGKRAASIPLSSNKSMLGHTVGAAGAIEAILTLEGIRRSLPLPTINYETPDPRCDLDHVPFGFGGHNASVCLGAFEDG
jgi:3-oxoacyl-[acyl-carrier-protein] synthase II